MIQVGAVSHVYNPSYSGGRDQENHGWRVGQANSWQDCYLENTQDKKRGCGVA
jgi:hypothetical protein